MIPYILAAVGGYLIGQSRKDQQYADGGMMKDGMADGQTDEELYDSLRDMGFDYGEFGSDDFDGIGFSEVANNLGYRWDDNKKLWFSKEMMARGGMKDGKIKLYHHKTSGGAEYLCSNKLKGTSDEGDLKSDICVRIDGAKTHGGELKIGDEKMKLYHHKTSGGAQYLCSSNIEGTDEGSFDSKYVVRIDGAKTHGGELMMKYAKGGKVKNKKWIQDALTGEKGALRKTAKRKGLLRGDEKLSMSDLRKLEKMGGKTAKRAYLAETLRKFDEGGYVKEVKDGDDIFYLTYIDSTHFFLSNSPEYKGNAYHVGQFKSRPFYNEVKEWLKSKNVK